MFAARTIPRSIFAARPLVQSRAVLVKSFCLLPSAPPKHMGRPVRKLFLTIVKTFSFEEHMLPSRRKLRSSREPRMQLFVNPLFFFAGYISYLEDATPLHLHPEDRVIDACRKRNENTVMGWNGKVRGLIRIAGKLHSNLYRGRWYWT